MLLPIVYDQSLNYAREKKALPTFLTSDELENARLIIIQVTQCRHFTETVEILKAGKQLPKRHPLLKLNPFYDKVNNIIRVGGRLTDSELSNKQKHPPILPQRSHVSRLFVREAHLNCLHGGPTLTTSTLAQRVWILGQRRLVKTVIRFCVPCQRVKPWLAHQMMVNLPTHRVTCSRPFSRAGLDYAGPFQIRALKDRGHKAYKGYIVLFVCFATRAIHLEVVTDLESESFILAFRRFIGRRGVCQELCSDNATTFHGADKILQQMFTEASAFYKRTAALLANDGTNWSFISANSPHYGGLWEAGVKSVKHHLKRIIGNDIFTFEELTTILVQIEACLNSRPLTPLSSDPEDLHALTPAHFLNNGTTSILPQKLFEGPENRLKRYNFFKRHFKNFGIVGLKSTCNIYKKGKNGERQKKILRSDNLYLCMMSAILQQNGPLPV